MYEFFKGYKIYQQLLKNQYIEKEKVENIQNKYLQKLIHYVYNNNRFYNSLFKKVNITPNDIKTKNDLIKIPIITKNNLTSNFYNVISKNYDIKNLINLKTSGSTGRPFIFYIDKNENIFRKAKHLRANKSIGQRIFDKWIGITAPHHFGKTSKLQRFFNIYCPRHISIFNSEETKIKLLKKIKPDIIDSYASTLFLLAKYIDQYDIKNINPKFCISSSEILDNNNRKFIEEVFESPVYDQYASVEFGRMAWECQQKTGYHIEFDNMIIEIISKNGEKVGFNEKGEIVCTNLFNYSMPFIRYAIGDIATISDEMCPCGRNLPMIKYIEGRKDSLIILPDETEISPRTFSVAMSMFKYYSLLRQFRVVQKTKNLFKIDLVLINKNVHLDLIENELLIHMRNIFKFINTDIYYDINFVEEIPIENSGKHRYIISDIV